MQIIVTIEHPPVPTDSLHRESRKLFRVVLSGGLSAGCVAKAELARQFATRVFLSRLATEFVERFDKEKC
ncbi:MAG: hypothetical protein ACREWE_08685 [Gammaproteobacteria bacterium]